MSAFQRPRFERAEEQGLVPVSTSPNPSTNVAAVYGAWIVWIATAILAIIILILIAVNLSRTDTVRDGVDGLHHGIRELQTSVAEVDEDVDNIETIASETLADVEELLLDECIPLSAPGVFLYPGCYFFTGDIQCDFVESPCYIAGDSPNVDVDMRGHGLSVSDPTGAGFGVYFSPNFRIRNGRIYTGSPSNYYYSRAVDTYMSDFLLIDKVVISNFFRPVAVHFSNYATFTRGVIEGASNINWDVFNNAAFYILGSNQTTISHSKFRNNNVPAVSPNDYRQFASHGIQSSSLDEWPCIGLTIEHNEFIDTRIRNTAFSFFSQISNLHILHNTFEITDPLYSASAIEIGDTDTVWNGTNTIDLGVVPITGVKINYNTFVNRNAHPAFDVILCKMMHNFEIKGNAITANNNGFDPDDGNLVVAHIHLGSANSGIDYQEINPFGVHGGTVEDNTLVGISNASDVRALCGILVEGYSYGITIKYNRVSGIGAGMPANPMSDWCIDSDDEDNCESIGQCGDGPYPAQQPAGIRVSAAARGIEILANTVWDGSCADGAFTVLPKGIAIAPLEIRASFCDTGTNVTFPAASDNVVTDNTVWNFCGKGISDLGLRSRLRDNKSHDNGASESDNYEYNLSNVPVISMPGDPALAGYNLEGPCTFC